METEGLLPCSKDRAIGPYPEPNKSGSFNWLTFMNVYLYLLVS
jgi:hypothetical protein